MVTKPIYLSNGKYLEAETFYGLAGDSKPTTCANGSVFIEIDTGSGFFFDAANSKWYPEAESKRSTKKKG